MVIFLSRRGEIPFFNLFFLHLQTVSCSLNQNCAKNVNHIQFAMMYIFILSTCMECYWYVSLKLDSAKTTLSACVYVRSRLGLLQKFNFFFSSLQTKFVFLDVVKAQCFWFPVAAFVIDIWFMFLLSTGQNQRTFLLAAKQK